MITLLNLLILSLGLLLSPLDAPVDDVTPLEIGKSAPDFNLMGTDDEMHDLASYSDAEVLAIVFTCNHCPTAQAYEQRIIDMVNDNKDRGVTVVAISPNDPVAVRLDELGYSDLNDSLEDMKIRAEDMSFPFDYLYDGDVQDVVRAYGPLATPHIFIFDKERKLRYQGRIDDAEKPVNIEVRDAQNAIDQILAGDAVAVETNKVFGCSIKWADKRDQAAEFEARWAAEEAELEMLSLDKMREIMANDTDDLRLVNFWATWCGPCITEFPDLVDINRMYRGRDFEMVTVALDDPERNDKVHEFLQEQAASMTNYHYEGKKMYDLVEAADPDWPGPLPYTALVAPGGEIIYRQLGEIDTMELKRAVVDYLGRVY